jgi:hypothetical protein
MSVLVVGHWFCVCMYVCVYLYIRSTCVTIHSNVINLYNC